VKRRARGWLLDALVGAALGALAIALLQLATRGAVDWVIVALAAAGSFLLYPPFAARGRRQSRS
jgi:hypothetical protein